VKIEFVDFKHCHCCYATIGSAYYVLKKNAPDISQFQSDCHHFVDFRLGVVSNLNENWEPLSSSKQHPQKQLQRRLSEIANK